MPDALVAAYGNYREPVVVTPPDLRPLVRDLVGQPIRRGGRFIHLALIGAARCVGARSVPPDTGIYFTTGRGDFETNVEIMELLFRDGVPPRPLSFINTVSNAACFYVAKHFGLRGRSNCIGGRYFGFEAALQMACLDIETGAVATALVGSTDIALAPLDVHRRRLGLSAEAPVAEAAHWLLIAAGAGTGVRIGGVEFLADRQRLDQWFVNQAFGPRHTLFAAGPGLDPVVSRALRDRCGGLREFSNASDCGYYDSRSGAVISAFAEAPDRSATTLVHVDAAPDGRFAVMTMRR